MNTFTKTPKTLWEAERQPFNVSIDTSTKLYKGVPVEDIAAQQFDKVFGKDYEGGSLTVTYLFSHSHIHQHSVYEVYKDSGSEDYLYLILY
jgi:predicted phage-related endonuclease